MKQIITLLLLLPLITFAQRIQSDYSEGTTARRIATTRVQFNGMGSSVSATANICEHDTLLRMNIVFRAGKPTFIDAHTTAVLHLANGQAVQVVHLGNYQELTAIEPGFLVFTLSEAVQQQLTTYPVTDYTIQTGITTINVALTQPQQSAFRNTIRLLQDHSRSLASLD